MMNKLCIQKFIEEHADWEDILNQKPYCLNIVRDTFNGKNLVLFKYNQIDSDLSLELVQECRGLILDADTFEIVSYPFKKFFNAGEPNAAEIDWSSCWVGEKLDGSITKVVKLGDKLLWSTNGVPNAFTAPLVEQVGCTAKSFGDLMLIGLKNAYDEYLKKALDNHWCIDTWFDTPEEWLKSMLQENHTYIFELTSPFNKVVVQWHETRLNFLGVRDNISFQETYFTDCCLNKYFNTPKVFPLTSLAECQKATEAMGPDQEGFVICDKNFNRIKVKSILYVSLSHMRNNGVLSYERGVDIVRNNELDEVLSYFPEFKEHLVEIKHKYEKLTVVLNDAYNEFLKYADALSTRKDFALAIQKEFGKFSGCGFALLDKKVSSVEEWLAKSPTKNIVKMLGLKEQ